MPAASTEPLAAGGAPTGTDRRLWVIAGVLGLVLLFFIGFLVGRGLGSDEGTGVKSSATPVKITSRQACGVALTLAEKALALQQRALANRAAAAQATADGDAELIGRLNAELEGLSQRLDKVERRLERTADRCRK